MLRHLLAFILLIPAVYANGQVDYNHYSPLEILWGDIKILVVMLAAFWLAYLTIARLVKRNRGLQKQFIRTVKKMENLYFIGTIYRQWRDINLAASLMFFSALIIAVSLLNDLRYHDYFGLDEIFSPTHIPFYFAFPVIVFLALAQSVGAKKDRRTRRNIFYLWFGIWLSFSAFIVNAFWHGLEFTDSYASPPHAMFFVGIYFIIFPAFSMFKSNANPAKNKDIHKITLILFYLSLILLVFVNIGWNDHPEDLGGSGFVDLSEEFATKHPHPDVKPLMQQMEAIRQISPFIIPGFYSAIISILAALILREKIFIGALSFIFISAFLIRSMFHLPLDYLPVLLLPIIALDAFSSVFYNALRKRYFLVIPIFLSLIFYLVYYPYTAISHGIQWPTSLKISIVVATFLISFAGSWVALKLIPFKKY